MSDDRLEAELPERPDNAVVTDKSPERLMASLIHQGICHLLQKDGRVMSHGIIEGDYDI